MAFYTRNNVKRVKVEQVFKKLPNFQLVRPLSVEQQVERFLAAGRQLDKVRGLGVYDFEAAAPIDDTLDDPTRDPDYDLIDAATTMRDLQLKQQLQASQESPKEQQEPPKEQQEPLKEQVS